MNRRLITLLAQWARGIWRSLGGGTYHPEQHYMRGPGPRTRAKSTGLPGKTP
jgi:hypothetical protein